VKLTGPIFLLKPYERDEMKRPHVFPHIVSA
jgi:hypothetical protein